MSDTLKAFSELRQKHAAVLAKLETAARAVVPVLLDHKLDNVAGTLKELIFELDAIDGEIEALIMRDPERAIRELLGGGALK